MQDTRECCSTSGISGCLSNRSGGRAHVVTARCLQKQTPRPDGGRRSRAAVRSPRTGEGGVGAWEEGEGQSFSKNM